MPRRVQTPDGQIHEFPDDATEDEIRAVIDPTRERPVPPMTFGQMSLQVPIGAAKQVGNMAINAGHLARRVVPGVASLSDLFAPPGMTGGQALEAGRETAGLRPQGRAQQAGAFAADLGAAALAPTSAASLVPRIASEAGIGALLASLQGQRPGVGAAFGGASPLVGRGVQAVAGRVGPALRESARTSLGKVFNPTNQENKALFQKRVDQWLDQGLVGTRGSLERQAARAEETAGQAVNDVLQANATRTAEVDRILGALDQVAEKNTINGVSFTPIAAEVRKLQQKLRQVAQVGTDPQTGEVVTGPIPIQVLVDVRRELDKLVDLAGGFGRRAKSNPFGNVLSNAKAWVAREGRFAIAEELAKDVPDLQRVNQAYSLARDTSDVLMATHGRKTGQQQFGPRMQQAAGAFLTDSVAAGAGTSGVKRGVLALLGGSLVSIIQSPLWRTVSAQAKWKLAEAVASGNPERVATAAGRILAQVQPMVPSHATP